jgi:hypothetical protein
MGSPVIATGVHMRLASEAEAHAVMQARRGFGFDLEPPRSFQYIESDPVFADDAVVVVSQTFVDFDDGASQHRWVSYEHHGLQIRTHEDATIPLLELARETAPEGLIDLLGDMGIAGLGISRWQLMSAPHRIERAADLQAALAPLRRR